MPETKYTLVQHSGFVAGGNPQFERAVEPRSVHSKVEEKAVLRVGGVLTESYREIVELEERINGVTGDLPFLDVKGQFADVTVGGCPVYIPVREIVG